MVSGKTPLCRLNCLIVLLCFLGGCPGLDLTNPNKPYKGPYTTGFNELSEKNPLLAQELGKLPEINDGLSDKEKIALEKIVKLYKYNPKSFNTAFNLMFRVGVPEVRRYCSPLQALYWMAEDGKHEEMDAIIDNYNLTDLLIWSWYFVKYDNENYYNLR
jgi:hypothetical protein